MEQVHQLSASESGAGKAAETEQAADRLVIQVENVTKAFQTPDRGTMVALENISLGIPYGEFVTVVGPSGCGKSTLLKLIAGLTPISRGRILYQGSEVQGLNTKVGYVPQESKLFPWLTLEENVAFGLDSKRYSRQEREEQLRQFIGLAGLAGFEKYYPAQLSGGIDRKSVV